jgi:hypothetical protein
MRNLISITFLFFTLSINAQTINTTKVLSSFYDEDIQKRDSVKLDIISNFTVKNDTLYIKMGYFEEKFKITCFTPYKGFNNYLISINSKSRLFEVNFKKNIVFIHYTDGRKNKYYKN